MALPFFNWSRTAASNATADATINWQEGQPPSSVNDSARAMMASTAAYRDDIAGAIVTTGTSTSYNVASYEVFDSLAHLNGQMIAFTPHATNGANGVNLNVDGLAFKPLLTSPGAGLLAGTLIQGTPYVAVYNNADGAFYLQGFYGNAYNIPLGAGLEYWGSSAPNSSFAFPVSQAISRTTYATLFALIGTTYGVGDGSTTFQLPDKRGRVSAALDPTGTILTSSTISPSGGSLGGVGGAQLHTLTASELPAHTHPNTLNDLGHTHAFGAAGSQGNVAGTGASGTTPQYGSTSNNTGSNNSTPMSITNAPNTGGGNAHAIVQPTIVCNYIMRII